MRLLLLLLIAVCAGAWYYPPQAEGVATQCAALQSRLWGLVADDAGRLPPALAADPRMEAVLRQLRGRARGRDGEVAETYVRDTYPQMPLVVGCVVAYWMVTYDADLSPYLRAAGVTLP